MLFEELYLLPNFKKQILPNDKRYGELNPYILADDHGYDDYYAVTFGDSG